MISISGMADPNGYYFTDSPVVINISGYQFGGSPVRLVVVEILYKDTVIGEYREDAGNSDSISMDISSALKSIWSEYDFSDELREAQNAADNTKNIYSWLRPGRQYTLRCHTEYIDSADGRYTKSDYATFDGGHCIMGGFTELERHFIGNGEWNIAALNHSNPRNGDASTKPRSTPEMVGADSITSWVDISQGGTKSIFYSHDFVPDWDDPDNNNPWEGHSPIVIRDYARTYIDFLFVNRRGAMETCSALMSESMSISIDSQMVSRNTGPSFKPSGSIMSIATGGRRSWTMSSGYQTREWAEWWAQEFLLARRWWMLFNGKYIEVAVEPANEKTLIYNRAKQQLPSVDFKVTLAFEG